MNCPFCHKPMIKIGIDSGPSYTCKHTNELIFIHNNFNFDINLNLIQTNSLSICKNGIEIEIDDFDNKTYMFLYKPNSNASCLDCLNQDLDANLEDYDLFTLNEYTYIQNFCIKRIDLEYYLTLTTYNFDSIAKKIKILQPFS